MVVVVSMRNARLCGKLGERDAGHRIGPLTSSDRSAN
jgi:hypothetical protein